MHNTLYTPVLNKMHSNFSKPVAAPAAVEEVTTEDDELLCIICDQVSLLFTSVTDPDPEAQKFTIRIRNTGDTRAAGPRFLSGSVQKLGITKLLQHKQFSSFVCHELVSNQNIFVLCTLVTNFLITKPCTKNQYPTFKVVSWCENIYKEINFFFLHFFPANTLLPNFFMGFNGQYIFNIYIFFCTLGVRKQDQV